MAAAPAGYAVKWIDFLGARRPILCQAGDGPCPLLAVANVFLLLARLELPRACEFFGHESLLLALQGYLESHPLGQGPDAEHFVNLALECLGQLAQGLCVDPRFTDPFAFRVNQGKDFFDNAEIRLCHAWVLEAGAAPPELVAQLGALSHDQACDKVTTLEEGSPARAALGAWVQLPEQATVHGVRVLARSLRNLELAAFFRGKHFSVIFKRCCCPPRPAGPCACPPASILLCELLTSELYLSEPNTVWQTLEPTEACLRGATTYLDAGFEPPRGVQHFHMPTAAPVAAPLPQAELPEDWAQMSPQERAAYQAAISASTGSSTSRSAAPSSPTASSPTPSTSSRPSAAATATSSVGKHDKTRQNAMMVGEARKASMARAQAAAAAGGGGAGGSGGGGGHLRPQRPAEAKDGKGCCIA